MTRILVVEDEPSLRTDLVDYLALSGFSVYGVGTARETYDSLARSIPPQILILDIGLPDGNGFDIAKDARAKLNCGIIMLSALGEADDRVHGLESGADIYLVKHSSLREIEACVRSLVRRFAPPPVARIDVGEGAWVLRQSTWTLTAPNLREIKLTATEFAFVAALIENAGKPCSREELETRLARPRLNWSSRHLDAVVNRLRRKIKEATDLPAPVQMVYGRGYAFSASGRAES